MLTVDEVLRVIDREIHPLESRQMPVADAAGAVLAADVKLDEDSPRFDRSQLDGFAVRAGDVQVGKRLKRIGRIDAGGVVFAGILGAGECVAINTGGVVPAGADAILMVEQAELAGNEVVAKTELKTGYGIQRRGSDAHAGELLLPAGTRLGAAQLAVCAAAGVAMPRVRKPRVAVLTTGDELVDDLSASLAVGKIRNSNRHMLLALAAEGNEAVDMGTCGDAMEPLRKGLEKGLNEADLLVVSGGMSMGTRDLAPPLLKELGVELHVEKVRIKPGKPFILGSVEVGGKRKYVAGLPGNPVSGFVTFQRFVRPALARMAGASVPQMQRVRMIKALPANGDREFYVPCVLDHAADGMLAAEILKWKGSADLFTLARANGLVIQKAEDAGLPAGAMAEVLVF